MVQAADPLHMCRRSLDGCKGVGRISFGRVSLDQSSGYMYTGATADHAIMTRRAIFASWFHPLVL